MATETVRPEPRPATSSVRAAGPDPRTGWVPLLGSALGAGPVAGAVLAAAAWASSGSLGGGHLAELGPRPWPLAGIVAGLVAAGAVVGAAATRTMLGVRRPADR